MKYRGPIEDGDFGIQKKAYLLYNALTMRILGIETSCDETAVAIVEDGKTVRENTIASVSTFFEQSGGVIPEFAARKQVSLIQPTIKKCLQDSQLRIDDIDAIAVTRGPGLLGSLLIGTVAARVLAYLHHKPLIGVHHTLGHLCSTWLDLTEDVSFPILTLSASGGHTDLWLRTSPIHGTLIGRTQDDAAGEAFDKGAALLDLPYPGGPSIATAAEKGDPEAFAFPLPLHDKDTLDYSFSGLKTALRNTINACDVPLPVSDLAASYQHALCRHLTDKVLRALEHYPDCLEVHLVGGVSANTYLRSMLSAQIGERTLRTPQSLKYCTDNAAMIASAAYYLQKEQTPEVLSSFQTAATVKLQEATS